MSSQTVYAIRFNTDNQVKKCCLVGKETTSPEEPLVPLDEEYLTNHDPVVIDYSSDSAVYATKEEAEADIALLTKMNKLPGPAKIFTYNMPTDELPEGFIRTGIRFIDILNRAMQTRHERKNKGAKK